MSGRTMPLSSLTDMVLCTSDRKKFTAELDMNLMCSNCNHETEKKYCKWHNIPNANSCLCHTYLSGISELAWLSLRKHALARIVSFFVFCCLVFIQAHCYILVLLQIKASSFICLSLSLCWKLVLDCEVCGCNSNKEKDLEVESVSDVTLIDSNSCFWRTCCPPFWYKMETTRFSKTLVRFHQTTRRHTPNDPHPSFVLSALLRCELPFCKSKCL